MMRNRIGSAADRLVMASPSMSADAYKSKGQTLSILDEEAEGIRFCTLFTDQAQPSLGGKIRRIMPMLRTIYASCRQSTVVHSGLSWDVWLPFEFTAVLLGILMRRRTVFVVDIDYRNSAIMSYRVGDWSWKSYAACRYIYDTLRSLQLHVAAHCCSLVLLKGKKLVSDFGPGRSNVRYILDAAHSNVHIIGEASLQTKINRVRDVSSPLRLTYFGRLTAYKGIDQCLRATAMARQLGANVLMDIIGSGEQFEALRRLSSECSADSYVRFHGGLPFDREFFNTLYQFHLLLAAPLREDTPRSALDAMAAGVPYLAFDTYYYRELLESGAGQTVPWLDVEAMAHAIVDLHGNRERLATMMENAVAYARANTQEIWLDRRMAWTLPRAA
ncbi:MAG TPA: glycosyltransferase [Terracidiphilus sp.]|nr:glycosyltransferase [Terracidiphilus sp.]